MMPLERGDLWRSALIVVASVAVAAGLAWYFEGTRQAQYRSIARLLITPNPMFYEGRDLLAGLETLERASIRATYVEVLNSSTIRAAAMTALPSADPSAEGFEVDSLVLPSADVLRVAAEGPSPRETAMLANEVVRQGLAYLQDRYPMYRVEVLDVAVPAEEPFVPDLKRALVLAAIVGAGFGVAIALFVSGSALTRRWAQGLVPPHAPEPTQRQASTYYWTRSERDVGRGP